MTKTAVVRSFFMDLLENLGYHVDARKEFEDEESTMILTNLFFDGKLELKWNPETQALMLKPEIVINLKDPQPPSSGTGATGAHTIQRRLTT